MRAALAQLAASDPRFAPRSVLDLGAGTGAALWAVADTFGPNLDRRAVEREPAMLALGRRLTPADWVAGDIAATKLDADLVVAGYALGEANGAAANGTPLAAAALARAQAVVVVEPGTPRGYADVIAVRDRLIEAGFTVAAPCRHAAACPMRGRDWCHFAVRLNRTPAMRRAKGGELGYEDEKFAFVAATRHPARPAPGRIVRHPGRHGGHIGLRVCGADGAVADLVVSKRDRVAFRAARKAGWGDPWPPDTGSDPGQPQTVG